MSLSYCLPIAAAFKAFLPDQFCFAPHFVQKTASAGILQPQLIQNLLSCSDGFFSALSGLWILVPHPTQNTISSSSGVPHTGQVLIFSIALMVLLSSSIL